MKRILVKELNKKDSVSQYIIYLMIGEDKTPIHAYIEIGEENKKLRVNEMILEHFVDHETLKSHNKIILEDIIFEEYLK